MSDIHMTDFDNEIYTETPQLLKAAIPYVNGDAGKALAVAAKLMELLHTVSYTHNPDRVSACSIDRRQATPEEMLSDLSQYCGPKEKEQLDMIIKIINIGKVYESAKRTPASAPAGDHSKDFLSGIYSMLTPEQLNLLKTINTQTGA